MLATLLGDEKLNAIKAFIEERQGGNITREDVERLLNQCGFTSIANSLEDDLKKGKLHVIILLYIKDIFTQTKPFIVRVLT